MIAYSPRANKKTRNTYAVLEFVREHPGASVVEIGQHFGVNWQTIRNHLICLENSTYVEWDLVSCGMKREHRYHATEAGMALDLDAIPEPKTKRGPYRKPTTWTNPYHEMTLTQRLDAIEADAIREGTHARIATLAPQTHTN